MNAKFRLLDDGRGAYLELAGKSMGEGVKSISYTKTGREPATLNIGIDVRDFSFSPDGYFDEVEKRLKEIDPPTKTIDGSHT